MAEVHDLSVPMFINGKYEPAGSRITVRDGWIPPQVSTVNHADASKVVLSTKATRKS